ncbi:flagellar biosynthetic protein FliO [Thalassotalea euphylliae]|uniref:Flagellar protein n=2 Tax=Thalassotalea euphylliae TaxID=1655234 RepID=A0A3E0UK50_9GAMM|nr:flagellar biosynthetic protein FliO [Thalassotalea euphylliae]
MPQLAPQQTAPEVGRHVASNNLELSSMLLSLLAVLALILLAASLLKKFKLGGQLHSDLKVITSMHIGTKERLVVVEVAGKQLLLGVTANNISILQELAEPITSQQNLPVDIAASLSKLLKK